MKRRFLTIMEGISTWGDLVSSVFCIFPLTGGDVSVKIVMCVSADVD